MLLKGRANPSRKTAVHRSACSANVQGAEYYEPQEEMLVGDQSFTILNDSVVSGWRLVDKMNRERELGLDRRETG
jgi:hypothetical protein